MAGCATAHGTDPRNAMNNNSQIQFECGVFTLSIDFELIWGTIAGRGVAAFRAQCELERQVIIDRLLALLSEFEMPASWLIVGHLLLDNCRVNHQSAQADYSGKASLECGPALTDQHYEDNRIFCGRDLVEKIRACRVPQEIGCHTFSHPIFTEENITRARAEEELAACVRLADELGIAMQSFAYPQNKIGHLDLLRQYGFTCYRGAEWHESGRLPDILRRLAHLWLVCTATTPPVHLPEFTKEGIWDIPGSMLYFPMHGQRRYLPLSIRVKRAYKGLHAAASQKRIFHLWFHPTNLADEMEQMFAGLRLILEYAAELREKGQLDFKPMGALVPAQAQSVIAPVLATAGVG